MCGIAGIFNFTERTIDRSELKRMTDPIAYRGPDAEGFWVSRLGNTGFGHRRLSILDLSELGSQPMHSADARYTITFNGEIYNYVELKAGLEARGHRFKSGTDTEVLLALYAEKKEACLSELDGMFAFAIWDDHEKTLFCARDRMGEKPFFYFHSPRDRFVFGSEMKCLFAAGVERRVREDRMFSFLAYSNEEDRTDLTSTFYANVLALEPAHYLKIKSDGTLTTTCYWRIGEHSDLASPPSFEAACERFYELFETSIRRRLRSDVPVGTCLSGGLDSSSIVVVLNKLKNTSKSFSQKTFSARMSDPKYDEGRHMQEIISRTTVEPHYTWAEPDTALGLIEKIFHHHEEPFTTTSCILQWLVMKLAAEQGVPVLIDGQGSDEMLAGYSGYFPIYFRELYLSDRERLDHELKAFAEVSGKPFDLNLRFRLEARVPEWLDRLGAASRRFAAKPYFRDLNPDLVQRYRGRRPPFERQNDLNASLRRSSFQGGLTHLLRMCDRNSMAFSREVRLPFLSHELIEFIFSLPPHYKIHDGWSKYILRKALEPLLPPSIAWRRDKMGFAAPQAEWMSHPQLRSRIGDAVLKLQKDRWIGEPAPEKSWNYIQAAMVLG